VATSAGLVLFVALVASTSIWVATRRIATLDITAMECPASCDFSPGAGSASAAKILNGT
jgi:hypothetical protein